MDCSSDFSYIAVTACTKTENLVVLLRALHKGFKMQFLVEDVFRFKKSISNSKSVLISSLISKTI